MSDIEAQGFIEDDELFIAQASEPSPSPSFPIAFSPFLLGGDQGRSELEEQRQKQLHSLAEQSLRFTLKQILMLLSRKSQLCLYSSFARWKAFQPPQTSFSNHLLKICFMPKKFFKIALKRYFEKWICKATFIKKREMLQRIKAKKQEPHKKKMLALNEEVTGLTEKQKELENKINAQTKKLNRYKQAIDNIQREDRAVSSSSSQIILQNLITKNHELKDKIEAVEANVNTYIEEMSALLDLSGQFPASTDDDGRGDSSHPRLNNFHYGNR